MNKGKLLSVLGIVVSVSGALLSLAADMINEKKMESTVEEKVRAFLTNKDE